MKRKISDKVDMSRVKFVRRKDAGRTQRAFVTYAPTTGTLYFNERMVKELQIANWKDAVVGFDPVSHVLLVRKADAEEYGTVSIRECKNTRKIFIRHCLRGTPARTWRAERNRSYIYLEAVNESKEMSCSKQ